MKPRACLRPLIPFLISYICGILTSARFPDYPWAVLIVFLLSLFWLIRLLMRQNTGGLCPLIFFFSLGYLSLLPWANPYFPPHHVIHFTDTHPWRVSGTVTSVLRTRPDRIKLKVAVEKLRHRGHAVRSTGNVRLTVLGHSDSTLSSGDRISFVSRLKALRNFGNPGGFDYRRYMAFKGIRAAAYVRQDKMRILQHAPKSGIRGAIAGQRQRIAELIEQACQTSDPGVLKALIVGDKYAVPKDVREAFNRAGVGHLLAISGLHMGILAAASFFLFTKILSKFDLFLWRAWTKKGAAILSLLPVAVYGMLAGMSPSTQRAAIMVGVFLMTFVIETEQDSMNTLAVAAFVILAIFPPSLFSISFQLSFSAVAAIIFGLGRIRRRQASSGAGAKAAGWHRMQRTLFNFILVSFFAILGTQPLAALYFNQISLIGLLVNLIAVPLVGFAVVPAGLAAVFLSFFSSTAAVWLFKLTVIVLSIAIESISFFAELPFAAVKTITPSWLEIGCLYGLAWTILDLATATSEPNQKKRFPGMPLDCSGTLRIRHACRRFLFLLKQVTEEQRLVKALLLGLTLVLAADVFCWTHHRFWHDDLRVTIIDVGQGSSALLELPKGPCMLVDGGGFSDNTIFDVGERIVAPFLWQKKIATVDTLVLSHANSDHLNGLLYIARNFNVKKIWCNHEPSNTFAYQEFLDIVEKNNIRLPVFEEVLKPRRINGASLSVLHPPIDFLENKPANSWRNINDNSLVLKVRYGRRAFLFPGDIMKKAEAELVREKKDLLKSDILIAPHHGSKTSSTADFLRAVDPEAVVFSAGWRNRFGFPAQEVLERYENIGSRVIRTDLHGAVSIRTDGESLEISTLVNE